MVDAEAAEEVEAEAQDEACGGLSLERVGDLAVDTAYVAVGLGLMAVNRVQAARRELLEQVEDRMPPVAQLVASEVREIGYDMLAQTKAVFGIEQ